MIRLEIARILSEKVEAQRPSSDHIVDIAISTTPLLERLVRKKGNFDSDKDRLFQLLYQRIAEVYTLEQIRMAAQEIDYPIELLEIPDGTITENYLFEKSKTGTIEVKHRITKNTVTDIDGLMAIGEYGERGRRCSRWQPFIVEVKIGAYGHCNGSEKDDGHFNDLTRIIKIPYSLKGIVPVLEFFEELYKGGEIENEPNDVGIIVAMPPDRFDIIREGGQRRFVQRGGNIVRFPFGFKEYFQLVYAAMENLGYRVA